MDIGLTAYANALQSAVIERPSVADQIAVRQRSIESAQRLITRAKPQQRRIMEANIRRMKAEIIDLEQ